MHAMLLRGLVACAALAASGAHAQDADPACQLPGQGLDPLGNRAGLLAEYERLPQACLREIFLACNEQSRRTLMDLQSAAVCSFGYEALLRQGFGGNFHALLAWWQGQRSAQ